MLCVVCVMLRVGSARPFENTNILQSPMRNCRIGGLNQHEDPMRVVSRCTVEYRLYVTLPQGIIVSSFYLKMMHLESPLAGIQFAKPLTLSVKIVCVE